MAYRATRSERKIGSRAERKELPRALAESDKAAYLPLYEAKMIHYFDHRFATYEPDGKIRDATLEEHQDPGFAPMPRYWVEEGEVEARLEKRDSDGNIVWRWEQPWLLGFRDIARSTDERTAIFSLIPRTAVSNKLPLLIMESADIEDALVLSALASSFAFDFAARQSIGGTTMNFYIVKQLPFPTPQDLPAEVRTRILSLAMRLYNSDAGLGTSIVNVEGYPNWDSEQRRLWRHELDALCFRLFSLSQDEAKHILDSFEVLDRRDNSEHGFYRTRAGILAALAKLEPFSQREDSPTDQS